MSQSFNVSPSGLPQGTAPGEAMMMMQYDANKKSALVAYVLWFFLGWLGIHRFYLGQTMSGVVMLLITALSWVLSLIFIGHLGFLLVGIWLFVDIFLIPGMTRRYNNGLIASLRGGRA